MLLDIQNTVKKITQDALIKRLASGGLYNGIGLLGSKVIMWVSTILFAKTLTKEEFGDWGYLWTTLLTIMLFVEGPFGSAIIKYVSEYKKTSKTKVGQVIVGYIIVTFPLFIIMIIASFFSNKLAQIIHHENLVQPIRYFILSLIPLALVSISKSVINGLEEFKINSFLLPFITLADFTIKYIGLMKGGFNGLTSSIILSNTMQLVIIVPCIIYVLKKNQINIVLKGVFDQFKPILTYSFPMLVYIVMTSVGNILLQSIFISGENGSETIAGYTAIVQLQSVVSFIPLMITTPMLASITASFQEDYEKTWISLKKFFIVFSVVMVVSSCALFIFSNILLSIYGESYIKYSLPLKLFIPAIILQILCPFLNQIFCALNHIWIMNISRVFWLLSIMIFGYIFIDQRLYGIIATVSIACFVWFIVLLASIKKLRTTKN